MAWPYSPGSGTLYSDDFEGALDENWEQENGWGTPSPWAQVADGGDTSFSADGLGPFPSSQTLHWARHFLHPTAAGEFSLAFEFRAELGSGYRFDLEVEQRAPIQRRVRMRIDGNGVLSLWRSENGALAEVSSSGSSVFPPNQKRWVRLAFSEDGGGGLALRVRVWSGGAGAEPSGWTLEYLDAARTIEFVHRFEIFADGPENVDTFLDDLDAFGDSTAGVPSTVKTIYLAELSHLDIGFTEPPDEIAAFGKTHLDQVLDNLDSDPDYRWMIENGWWLDQWWQRSTGPEHERLITHLQSGRLTLAAAYASLHTTKAGHEEFTRQLYYTTRLAREHEFPLRTLIVDDVPGSSFAYPELLARSGVEYYLGGMNTGFGGRLDEPDHGDRPFWWVGPDGSRVLSWITFDSYAEAFQWGFSFFDTLADMYTKMGQKLPEQEEAGYPWADLLILRGFDNHYQGFKARNLIDQWNATYDTPHFVLATAEEFLDHMLSAHGDEAFPSYGGDFGAAWSPSNASAQHTQTMVRQSHRIARAAEALLAAASVLDGAGGGDTGRELMYRKMLESDEHTGAGGWPGYFTPEELESNNRQHLAFAEDAVSSAEDLLEEGLQRALEPLPAAGDAIAVVNALGRGRDGWARLALPSSIYASSFRLEERPGGSEVPYQRFDASEEILFRARQLPAVGYRVYDIRPGEPQAEPGGLLSVSGTTLENDFYLIEISSSDGSVASFYDKVRGREMVDGASSYRFNELAYIYHQRATAGDPVIAEAPSSVVVSIDETGPLRVGLRVTREGTPHVETTYRLYREEDRLEIENVLDRSKMPYVTEAQHSIKYTVTLPFDIHDFEIRSETTTRFLDPVGDSFVRSSVFDWHNTEHALAVWDENAGILAAVDSVSSHHLERIKTLGAAAYTRGDALLLPRMNDKADEYEFDDGSVGAFEIEPDTSPILHYLHHFRATDPAFDPVIASRFGFEALSPPLPRLISRRPGNLDDAAMSFFSVDRPGVLLYTAKPADLGPGVILRMTELEGQDVTARVSSGAFAISSAELVDQDEEGGETLLLEDGEVLVPLTPYMTATVRLIAGHHWAPIDLWLDKAGLPGNVHLEWSGGVSPYTLLRAPAASFSSEEILVDEEATGNHDDPVLGDGQNWFYLVK